MSSDGIYCIYVSLCVESKGKQGYKSDVSMKAGIHLFVSWENIPLILTYSNLQAIPFFI